MWYLRCELGEMPVCGSWTCMDWVLLAVSPRGLMHPGTARARGVETWWQNRAAFLQLLIHQCQQTRPPARAPAPAAEQRQVWSRSPSLGPWHPPLGSTTDRVGSVSQVGTVKINGAGAGWVGQSPGLTRSLLEIECPAQAKNQT